MKKTKLLITAISALMLGCSTIQTETNVKSRGRLESEPMGVITRPSEFGVGEIQDVTGKAFTRKLFWFFTIGGDEVSEISVLGSGDLPKSKLVKLASYRAVNDNNLDGIYLTSAKVELDNVFFGIYSEKNVEVKGKGFKIEDLGRVSQQRSDIIRESKSGKSENKLEMILKDNDE